MPQLLKSDYFSSTTVDTSENININYSSVLPFHLTNDDAVDIVCRKEHKKSLVQYNY